MTAPAIPRVPSKALQPPIRDWGDLAKRARTTAKTNELALQLLAFFFVLAVMVRDEKLLVYEIKFLVLNWIAVKIRDNENLTYRDRGVTDGIQLGCLIYGIHNLSLTIFGQKFAPISGCFYTWWALFIIPIV